MLLSFCFLFFEICLGPLAALCPKAFLGAFLLAAASFHVISLFVFGLNFVAMLWVVLLAVNPVGLRAAQASDTQGLRQGIDVQGARSAALGATAYLGVFGLLLWLLPLC